MFGVRVYPRSLNQCFVSKSQPLNFIDSISIIEAMLGVIILLSVIEFVLLSVIELMTVGVTVLVIIINAGHGKFYFYPFDH